jgi:uncharacterized protein
VTHARPYAESTDWSTATRSVEPKNRRTHMPKGNYSYSSESCFAITEPENHWAKSQRNAEPPHAHGDDETHMVLAKEPDRPGTSRRSSSRSRSRSAEESGGEGSSRETGMQRGGASSRRRTQARRASDQTQERRTAAPESRIGGRQKKSRRGFAAMSAEQQREIARKGGLTVSRNRRHMADIGRIGGEHSHGGRRGRAASRR